MTVEVNRLRATARTSIEQAESYARGIEHGVKLVESYGLEHAVAATRGLPVMTPRRRALLRGESDALLLIATTASVCEAPSCSYVGREYFGPYCPGTTSGKRGA